jgi:hypothetical protein
VGKLRFVVTIKKVVPIDGLVTFTLLSTFKLMSYPFQNLYVYGVPEGIGHRGKGNAMGWSLVDYIGGPDYF